MKKLLLFLLILTSFTAFCQFQPMIDIYGNQMYQINTFDEVNFQQQKVIRTFQNNILIPNHGEMFDTYLELKMNPLTNQGMINVDYYEFVNRIRDPYLFNDEKYEDDN